MEAYEKYFLVDEKDLNDIQQQIKLDDEQFPLIEKVNKTSESNNNPQTIQNQDYLDNDVSELDSSDDPGNNLF